MATLNAFADEVTDDFLEQVKYLATERVGYLEIRFVNQKNIMDLTQDALNDAKKMLQDHGIKVCAIGSPIGKVRIDEPFEPHLDKFKHAVDLAQFFETSLIRMFSYYPPEDEIIEDYRGQVMERMAAKVALIENTDVVMVHENETHIYGHNAENCVDIVKTIGSPKLRLVYDPGNFVWGQKMTDNVERCWPLMKPHIAHIHIKD